MKAESKIKRRFAAFVLCLGCGALIAAAASGCVTSPSQDPQPPSGGQNYVLDYGVFAAQIDSILTDHGCDNTACHGGGIRGTYELSPNTAKDIDLDYAQSSLQVNGGDPVVSPLLIKPLTVSAGGLTHAGGDAFTATSDPGYQAILAWIQAGEYQ